MGVTTYTHDVSSTVAPTRLFKAFVLDANNLFPKLMPQVVKNIETVEGDGGSGSIKKMHYVEGGQKKYLKHKLHVVDEKNLVTKYSVIEGDVLGDKLEEVTYDVKYEASGNGGCVCRTSNEYHAKGDYLYKEEEHSDCKDKGINIFKVVEAYLLANPTVYA